MFIGDVILLEKSMKSSRKKRKNHCEHDDDCEVVTGPNAPLQFDEIVEDFLTKTRRLLLVGEIDEIASAHICSYLQVFSLKKDPVYMYINSPGGCLASGYAIIDQMLACDCPIYTIIRGQAHSMGAIIAAFGQSGYRYSTPNSSIMLHSIVVQNASGHIEKHAVMLDYIRKNYSEKIVDLARRMKLTTEQLADTMNDTIWMSPKQAVKIGLIDGIWTPRMERSINKGFSQ